MEKSNRPAIIESALVNVNLENLGIGDTIEICSLHLPNKECSDRSVLDSRYRLRILAVTGLIVAISEENETEKFGRWLTIPQLKQYIINWCDTLLAHADNVEIVQWFY